jgi:hypothetical protein
MNCQEFWNEMPELGGKGEAEPGHGAECEDCATLIERHRALAADLRRIGQESAGLTAPAPVEAALLEEFRAWTGLSAYRRLTVHRRAAARRFPLLAWMSAAAAVVALVVLMARDHRPSPVERSIPNTSRAVGPVVAQAEAEEPVQAAMERTAAAGDETGESLEDFIPLPYATQVTSTDDLNVVRIEVQRSAVLALGLPAGGDDDSETVLADVLLGPDGMARAIRVVE